MYPNVFALVTLKVAQFDTELTSQYKYTRTQADIEKTVDDATLVIGGWKFEVARLLDSTVHGVKINNQL